MARRVGGDNALDPGQRDRLVADDHGALGDAVPPPGCGAAALPPHDKIVGRRARTLEATVVDFDLMPITCLDQVEDPRELVANVAGPAALLVSKAYKLPEPGSRQARRDRRKDAGDVVRLMLGTDAATRFALLLDDPHVGEVSATGLRLLRELFAGSCTRGTEVAARTLAGDRVESLVHPIADAFFDALPKPD